MAVGWARDGAVQEQVDANVDDAVQRARARIPTGESKAHPDYQAFSANFINGTGIGGVRNAM